MTRLTALLALLPLTTAVLAFFPFETRSSAPSVAAATSGTGTVAGHVFHDLDGDGVRDDGEPGLRRLVQVVQGAVIAGEQLTGADGKYSITGIPAGGYELVTELDGAISFCIDFFVPNFNPLLVAGCHGIIPQPWHPTTPERFAVSVSEGEVLLANFGATPFDQSVLLGLAILEDDYAPPGTVIEARANGELCGTTVVPGGAFSGANYRILILGAQEQAGCAQDGQPVTLRVGDVDALEATEYRPQITQTDPGDFIHKPVAMPNHAWYWLQEVPTALPPAGTTVRAMIDGRQCGETRLDTQSGMGVRLATGFYRLVVPSDSVAPGCGHPGAKVELRFGDTEATTSIAWQPGVHRLPLDVPLPEPSPTPAPSQSPAPTPSPTLAPSPAALPQAGGEPGRVGGFGVWLAFSIPTAIIITGLFCLGALRSIRVR